MGLKRWYVRVGPKRPVEGLCELCGEAEASTEALLEGLNSENVIVEAKFNCCKRCASVILGDSPSPADELAVFKNLSRIENEILGPQQLELFGGDNEAGHS